LLWQSAYAELYFEDVCWPDFKPVHLEKAVREYAARARRFGNIPEMASKNSMLFRAVEI
jgi:undecaprenyl diphosphate synthase